jgi:hypothetical protein
MVTALGLAPERTSGIGATLGLRGGWKEGGVQHCGVGSEVAARNAGTSAGGHARHRHCAGDMWGGGRHHHGSLGGQEVNAGWHRYYAWAMWGADGTTLGALEGALEGVGLGTALVLALELTAGAGATRGICGAAGSTTMRASDRRRPTGESDRSWDGGASIIQFLGASVGALNGASYGAADGASIGTLLGAPTGAGLGPLLGASVGALDGASCGAADGASIGTLMGASAGAGLGPLLSASVGASVGAIDGASCGAADGASIDTLVDASTGAGLGTLDVACGGSSYGSAGMTWAGLGVGGMPCPGAGGTYKHSPKALFFENNGLIIITGAVLWPTGSHAQQHVMEDVACLPFTHMLGHTNHGTPLPCWQ